LTEAWLGPSYDAHGESDDEAAFVYNYDNVRNLGMHPHVAPAKQLAPKAGQVAPARAATYYCTGVLAGHTFSWNQSSSAAGTGG